MKKRTIAFLALLTLLMTVPLTACGSKDKKAAEPTSELKGKKLDKKESDVVSERTEEVDGQKVTIKTFKDGTEMTVPQGVNLDDMDVQGLE